MRWGRSIQGSDEIEDFNFNHYESISPRNSYFYETMVPDKQQSAMVENPQTLLSWSVSLDPQDEDDAESHDNFNFGDTAKR